MNTVRIRNTGLIITLQSTVPQLQELLEKTVIEPTLLNVNYADRRTGNGMLCVEIAREGFTKVVGVDYCQEAVDLARQVRARHVDLARQVGRM